MITESQLDKISNYKRVHALITEEQYNFIIMEGDLRPIITGKLGLSQEVADAAYEISEKYAVWIAKKAKNSGGDPLKFIIDNEQAIRDAIVKME